MKYNWLIFTQENSNLPHNALKVLLKDTSHSGGLWIGTSGAGLAHFNANDEWQVFEDKTLPKGNVVSALANDGKGGVWVGTHQGGFAHLNNQDEWRIFNIDSAGFLQHYFDDFNLPNNQVKAMVNDGKGGVWLGTLGGLAYLSDTEEWQFFNTDNSELPDNMILAIPPSGQTCCYSRSSTRTRYWLQASTLSTLCAAKNSNEPVKICLTVY